MVDSDFALGSIIAVIEKANTLEEAAVEKKET